MRRRLRTFAMLDTILAPNTRSFEWHPRWNKAQQVGAFKDGEGNFFFAWFCPHGAVVRGFDHESKMSPFRKDPPEIWPGMFDGIPKSLSRAMSEPAFDLDETTFCFWAAARSGGWHAGETSQGDTNEDVDGSESLLRCFRQNFRQWASTYYGVELDAAALGRLWWGSEPLDWDTLEALNVDFDERAVREEAELLEWEVDLSKRDSRTDKVKVPKVTPIRIAMADVAETLGVTEFVVRCEPTGVVLRVGDRTVAMSHEDVYDELLDLVRARLDGG